MSSNRGFRGGIGSTYKEWSNRPEAVIPTGGFNQPPPPLGQQPDHGTGMSAVAGNGGFNLNFSRGGNANQQTSRGGFGAQSFGNNNGPGFGAQFSNSRGSTGYRGSSSRPAALETFVPPKFVTVEEPKKEEPKPVIVEEPKPVVEEKPKPVVEDKPKPVEEPKPVVGETIKAIDKRLHGLITLQVGSEKFAVNTLDLVARSTLFMNSMLADNDQANTRIVQIDGQRPEVVEQFIEYIHFGSIDKLDEVAEGLVVLAEKFGIHELKEVCQKHLDAKLTDKNIIQRLIRAFETNDDKLKRAAVEYVSSPNSSMSFHAILNTDEWKSFASKNALLALVVFGAVYAKE